MISEWGVDCPVCDSQIWGDDEGYGMDAICPNCGSKLKISAEPSWDTDVEVVEERHDDLGEGT